MRKSIVIICLLLSLLTGFRAGADALSEARKYCESKDYTSALGILQEQISRQGASSALFYDLGNVYYLTGNYGGAVLNYEKALKLDHSNAQAKNNLKVVNSEVRRANESLIGDRNIDPAPQQPDLLSSVADTIVSPGSDFWCVVAIVVFLLGILAIAGYLLLRSVTLRKWGFFGGGVLIILAMISLLFSWMAKESILSTDRAVIMQKEVTLKSTPEAAAKPVGSPLTTGTVLKIVGTSKDKEGNKWLNAVLNTDYAGWLRAEDIEIITVQGLK